MCYGHSIYVTGNDREDETVFMLLHFTIDMRRVSRPPPPFPLCADCVPFELVLSAALLYEGRTAGDRVK
jgi:hypothetical protein